VHILVTITFWNHTTPIQQDLCIWVYRGVWRMDSRRFCHWKRQTTKNNW